MKKISLALSFLFLCIGSSAQMTDIEAAIRALDQQERKAVLAHDTATLLQLWGTDFTVNSPMNFIAKGGRNTLDRPVMQIEYSSFERQTELVIVRDAIAISMGGEVVVIKGTEGAVNDPIKRRYTNIWQKQGTGWKLIARHANIICTVP
jgi:ketosteroid isomerase-like protein